MVSMFEMRSTSTGNDSEEFLSPTPDPAIDAVESGGVEEQAGAPFQRLPPFPRSFRQCHLAIYWLAEFGFGLLSLLALLAFLAAIPGLNFLALGYLLEAEGRVARTGKLRYAMPLLPLAPKLGGMVLGTWFWCWMVRLFADATSDAMLVAPGSTMATVWQLGLILFSLGVALHLVLALARGGRLSLFFWPTPLNALWLWKRFYQGGYWQAAGIVVSDWIAALRLRHHFWLGLRGFLLAFVWLFIPTACFSVLRDTSKPGQVVVTLVGGVALAVVLSWVPFLQAHFAAENRWRAMFEIRIIRELYRKAPLTMLFSLAVLYAFSLPLYPFKAAALPKDVYWLLTPIFILSIYPAKILVGWAYSWAIRREQRAWRILRWACSLLMMTALGLYVFVLFFTPAIGAAGRAVLFQHHGILLPWPF